MSSPALINAAGQVPQFDVHDRARKARTFAGMERQDLADATGISVGTISNVETGKVTPRRSTIMLWALATGVDYEWLSTGGDNESNDSTRVTCRYQRRRAFSWHDHHDAA